MPSADVIDILDALSAAQNTDPFQPILWYTPASESVRCVQLIPSGDVAAIEETVPPLGTAHQIEPFHITDFHTAPPDCEGIVLDVQLIPSEDVAHELAPPTAVKIEPFQLMLFHVPRDTEGITLATHVIPSEDVTQELMLPMAHQIEPFHATPRNTPTGAEVLFHVIPSDETVLTPLPSLGIARKDPPATTDVLC